VTGTGPGTFAKQYERIKRPESEMARAAHNDYIQQACDSGIPGLLTFAAFIVGLVIWMGVRLWHKSGWGHFLVWLGVLGIALQCLTEFSFYVPAISWPFMVLLGWLVARSGNASTPNQPHP
jgi:O-antigen ligase